MVRSMVARGSRQLSQAVHLPEKYFPEISKLHSPATFSGLRVAQHLPQLLSGNALFVSQGFESHGIYLLRNDVLGGSNVARAEIENAARALAVAAGTPGFLVITLERFWQVVVHDPSHIGLVDTHAKGDGGDDYLRVIANERFLVVATRLCIETGVVRQRADAIVLQLRGKLIDALAREAIDDARAAITARKLSQFRVRRACLGPHGVIQVGAIETRNMNARLAQGELLHDIPPDPLGGSGCERRDWHPGKPRAYAMELAILRAEIVTPVRNAMCLVDDQRGYSAGGVHPWQDFVFKLRLQQSLRSHVQQLELAALQARQALQYFRAFERGVDEGGFDAVVLEQAYLVLHQRDQRRYHDAYPRAKQGRELKAQRLATAGGHDCKQVAAAQDVAHDFLLPGTKGIKSKALLERGGEGGWRQVGGQRVIHAAKHKLASRRRCDLNPGASVQFLLQGVIVTMTR